MIKKLLKKIILLLIIVLSCLSVLLIGFYLRIRTLKVDEKINTIICGDSHPQSGIDDALLKNSLNVCQMSEPYIGTYHVIKVLTAQNSHIKTIILGFSYHNLSKSEEDQFSREDFSKFFYPKYLLLLNPLNMLNMILDNFSNVVKTLPLILRSTLFPLFSSELSSFSFVGQYYRSQNSNCNDSTVNNAIQRHYIRDSFPTEISIAQEKYLKAIVEYCNSKNIKLYLLNTPLNKEYEKRIPEKFIANYYSVYEQIKNQAVLLDFHDLRLSYLHYGDGDHLNEMGAAVLTGKVDSLFSVYQGNLVPLK